VTGYFEEDDLGNLKWVDPHQETRNRVAKEFRTDPDKLQFYAELLKEDFRERVTKRPSWLKRFAVFLCAKRDKVK
jgi:hypothetical protein